MLRNILRKSVFSVVGLAIAPTIYAQNQIFDPNRMLAPYVPTPERIVEKMLEIADLKKSDVVYDLGSGDGRILIEAVQTFKTRAVGVEINPTLVAETRRRVLDLGLHKRIEVIQQHLMDADLSPATVVTVYLLTETNSMLRPKLERELQPGTRVVSHDFRFRGWTPVDMVEVEGASRTHRVYLYRIGATAAQ